MKDKKSRLNVDEKVRIVLQTFNPNTSIAELCREHNLIPKTVYNWKNQFLEGGRGSLGGKDTAAQTKNHRKEVAELKRIIGEHAVVIYALKKHWRERQNESCISNT